MASTIGSEEEGTQGVERAGLANSERSRSGETPIRRRIGIAWALGVVLLVVFVALAVAPGLAIARHEMMGGTASAGPTAGTATP